MDIILEFLREHQVIMTFIMVIMTLIILILSTLTFYYSLENRYTINKSQVTITTDQTEIKGQPVFTGTDMEFIIINKTSTPTYISKEPKLYLRVCYDWTKLYRKKEYPITRYMDLQENKTYPLKIEGRQSREYFNYKLRTEFFKWIKEDIENDKIRTVSVFLTFYNDTNKKTKQTRPKTLDKQIWDSKTQWNLNSDRMKDILK